MDEMEPSSATWTSRTTSPARCAARASRGYWGSVRLRRRVSACAGDSQMLWDGTILVGASLVGASFVVARFGGGGFAGGGVVVGVRGGGCGPTSGARFFLG